MKREATLRGLPFDDPWSCWAFEESQDDVWAEWGTPDAVSDLVLKLRGAVGDVRTISTTFPAEVAIEMREQVEALLERSMADYQEAIGSGRAKTEDYIAVARLLSSQGDVDGAEQMARAAIASNERHAGGWSALGSTLFRRDRFAEAAKALERSVELDPTDALALLQLAESHYRLGNDERAAACAARATALRGGEFI